ncbi:MAG: hypothetical protein ACXVGN_09520 [Mycobacteriaceae bacterium]
MLGWDAAVRTDDELPITKPIDPLVGKAIEAWEAVRPDQPRMLDRKTGERADFLFAFRARHVAKSYINGTIIPSLCRKAGVPTADVRGSTWAGPSQRCGTAGRPSMTSCSPIFPRR